MIRQKQRILELLLAAVTIAAVVRLVCFWAADNSQPVILQQLTVQAQDDTADRLDINRATAEELQALPGIGPVLAQRLLDWREENGDFRSEEDILSVSGIGQAIYEKIAPYITF
jgi:competence protein ComEA